MPLFGCSLDNRHHEIQLLDLEPPRYGNAAWKTCTYKRSLGLLRCRRVPLPFSIDGDGDDDDDDDGSTRGKRRGGGGGRRRKKDGEREREKGGGRRKESIRSRDRFVSNYSRWSRYARCLATSRGDAAGVRTPRSVAAPRAAGRGLPDRARATITDVMCRFSLLSVLFSLTGTDNSPSLSLSVGLLFFTLGPISRMKKEKIERDEM